MWTDINMHADPFSVLVRLDSVMPFWFTCALDMQFARCETGGWKLSLFLAAFLASERQCNTKEANFGRESCLDLIDCNWALKETKSV